jgi:chromosome segregation ATPase
MTKFGTLLGLKPTFVAEKPTTPAAAEPDRSPDKNVLELDQELFFPLASQLGEENEAVRNLLIDAEHKIGELETIKRSIGRLVDPVSKTLRAFEDAKSEKLTLQNILNNTRLAHAKLRDELQASEKKANAIEAECTRLRELLTIAQQSVSALENTRNEQSAELTARRAQIADLQRRVQQQATDLQILREENQRSAERVATTERTMVQLKADSEAAEQKFLLADRERSAVQALLEKALADSAQLSRRLLDTDKSLNATQTRLLQTERALNDTQAEATRLTAALDEANERHRSDMNTQNARYEALEARSELSEKLLSEARQTLAARADEISAFNRRVGEASRMRESIEGKFGQLEIALSERDTEIRSLEETRATLLEQNEALHKAVGTRESAFNRAQEKIQAQSDMIELLENQLRAASEATALQIEELNAQLQRERLERSMAEGALETGRKDIARLLRELAALQYRPGPSEQDEVASPEQTLRYRTAA